MTARRPACVAAFRTLLLVLIASLSPAASARAASLFGDGTGGRAMALGGAGTAVAGDPLSALFNNPAALSDLARPAVQAGVGAGFLQGTFRNRANRDGGDLDEAGVLGSFAAVLPAGPFRFALGLNPDIAVRANWRYRDAPGGLDGGTTYGVQPHESEILLLRGAFGASWQITSTLSLGVSLGLLYNQNRLRAPYVFQTQRTLRGAKVRLDLETDGFGVNAGASLRWRPVPSVALSLSYLSPSRVESRGTARGTAEVQLANLGLGTASAEVSYDAKVTNHFPQQLSVGVAWQVAPRGRLTLAAQFDWVNWADAFDTLPVRLSGGGNADLNGLVGSTRLDDDIPLRWRDQFIGRFGIEAALGEHWALRAGYAYGNNPVPAGTLTPLTAAINEHLLTAGVGYRRGRWSIDAAYQWRLPATGRVRGRSDLLAGEYSDSSVEVSAHVLGVTATVEF